VREFSTTSNLQGGEEEEEKDGVRGKQRHWRDNKHEQTQRRAYLENCDLTTMMDMRKSRTGTLYSSRSAGSRL
jgi:hypothetical protein